jgi:hypothetical protein
LQVALALDEYYRRAHNLEEYFTSNADVLAKQAEQAGRPLSPPFQFQLQVFGQGVFAVETKAKVAWPAFRLPDLK